MIEILHGDAVSDGSGTAAMVAASVRESILRGELRSGEQLRQDKIAADYGVSKIPVREALHRLEADGLVTFYANRGAFVSELTADEAREIAIIRVAMETVALRHAIPHLTTEHFARAERIIVATDNETDPFRWSELNWSFHANLYRPAQLPRLQRMLRTLYNNVARYFVIYQAVNYSAKSQQEHREILDACQRGRANLACILLENHLKDAADVLVANLEKMHIEKSAA